MKVMRRVTVSITASVALAISFAPTSAADPTTHLKSEIDAARSAAGCPALQLDPVLNDASQRVAREVDDFVKHNSRTLPTSGETDLTPTGKGGLLKVLSELGYGTTKAKLLTGYGDYLTGGPGGNEDKSIKATVLQGSGFNVFADCTYTKYGLSAINDDSSGGWPSTAPRTYTVTVVVVAGD